MFNVGILAARRSAPKLVNLTSAQVGPFGGSSALRMQGNGVFERYVTTNAYTPIPGEWYVPGPVGGIGSQFQYRTTLGAGVPLDAGQTYGGWVTIGVGTASIFWIGNKQGRILLEIRDVATQTVQASAQFWTAGFAP